MRALVTGGAGFIGSHLVKKLVTHCSVLNYDKLTYSGRLENLEGLENNSNYQFVKGDILDKFLFAENLKSFKPTVIFHLAAESHVDRSIDSCENFVKTNIEGTQKVLQETLDYYKNLSLSEKKNFKFIHVSTDEVFGALGEKGSFTEDSSYQPNSPYAASKASSDFLARAFYKTYGLPVIITNCSNNYGSNQYPEKLIPLMILNMLEGKKLPVYGKGLQIRDWLYVQDHINALIELAIKGRVGEQYCIGGGVEISNLELVKIICNIMDKKFPEFAPHNSLIEFVEDRLGHDFRYSINAEKISKEINWSPSTNFKENLINVIDWYIDNRNWVAGINNESRNRRGFMTLAGDF